MVVSVVTGPDAEILTDVQGRHRVAGNHREQAVYVSRPQFGFSQRAHRRLCRELYRVAARADVAQIRLGDADDRGSTPEVKFRHAFLRL